MTPSRVALVIPLKRFDTSKSRLRDALRTEDVTRAAERLARAVLAAGAPRRRVIVGDDETLAAFAAECGVEFLVCRDGLNASAEAGRVAVSTDAELCVIAHGDLARPDGLGTTAFPDGVTLVPDRHGRGTNVLAVPTTGEFTFGFGPDSARHHADEARRRGLALTVWETSPWSLDVDTVEDWRLAQQ